MKYYQMQKNVKKCKGNTKIIHDVVLKNIYKQTSLDFWDLVESYVEFGLSSVYFQCMTGCFILSEYSDVTSFVKTKPLC